MYNKGVSILVVDDDESTRDSLALLLGVDYTCATAASAEEAMRLLVASRFDLVITDMYMPGASGLEVCRLVQRLCTDTVVIAVSGMSDIRYEIEALRQGALYYIEKPVDPDRLSALVESALKCQALAAARHRQDPVARLARSNEELSKALSEMVHTYNLTISALIRSLTTALDVRDVDTRGHSNRVVSYSRRLGQELGFEKADQKALELGALLHDIGKIGVADSILLKPEALTLDEWAEMRKHPENGARIVERIPVLQAALPVILQHHERWDGKGYPAGLAGEQIDFKARIFAVADALDAITSNRPYDTAHSFEEARTELLRCAGKQFDPAVVEAFGRIPIEEWASLHRVLLTRDKSRESGASAQACGAGTTA